MRISDWSSDVCSSDLLNRRLKASFENSDVALTDMKFEPIGRDGNAVYFSMRMNMSVGESSRPISGISAITLLNRSEEHTSELQSLMRISYAVFCLKKKNNKINKTHTNLQTPQPS